MFTALNKKRMTGLMALAFSIASLGIGPSEAKASPDWTLINTGLTDVANDHVNAFGFIHSAHVFVDVTQTNWTQGRFVAGFDVQSIDLLLLSSTDIVNIELSGSVDLQTKDIDAQSKQVDMSFEVALTGGVIDVLRHINELIADCSAVGADETFLIEFCAYSSIIAGTDDVSKYALAMEHLKAAILSLNNVNTSLTGSFAWLSEFFNVLSAATITGDDTSVNIDSQIALQQVFGLDISADISMKLTAEALIITITGDSTLLNADYDQFKQSFEAVLLSFQEGDPDTISTLYQYSFLVFGLIEGFLN